MILLNDSGEVSSSLLPFSSSPRNGQVHSLFKNSLNAIFDDELINLSKLDMQCSSFGMVLTDEAIDTLIRSLKIGDQIRLKDDSLIFFSSFGGVIKLNLTQLTELDLKIKTVNFSVERIKAIEEAILTLNWDQEIGLPLDETSRRFLRSMTDQNLSFLELKESFSYLVGRGQGLTPSGDDIILGYLTILTLFGKSLVAEMQLLEELSVKTTLISANYMRLLARGYVSQYFCDLCNATRLAKQAELNRSAQKIIQIGATSGSDTLLGMALGLGYFGGNIQIPRLFDKLAYLVGQQLMEMPMTG